MKVSSQSSADTGSGTNSIVILSCIFWALVNQVMQCPKTVWVRRLKLTLKRISGYRYIVFLDDCDFQLMIWMILPHTKLVCNLGFFFSRLTTPIHKQVSRRPLQIHLVCQLSHFRDWSPLTVTHILVTSGVTIAMCSTGGSPWRSFGRWRWSKIQPCEQLWAKFNTYM